MTSIKAEQYVEVKLINTLVGPHHNLCNDGREEFDNSRMNIPLDWRSIYLTVM